MRLCIRTLRNLSYAGLVFLLLGEGLALAQIASFYPGTNLEHPEQQQEARSLERGLVMPVADQVASPAAAALGLLAEDGAAGARSELRNPTFAGRLIGEVRSKINDKLAQI